MRSIILSLFFVLAGCATKTPHEKVKMIVEKEISTLRNEEIIPIAVDHITGDQKFEKQIVEKYSLDDMEDQIVSNHLTVFSGKKLKSYAESMNWSNDASIRKNFKTIGDKDNARLIIEFAPVKDKEKLLKMLLK